MLSKFSRVILGNSFRVNSVFSAAHNIKSILKCTHVRVSERSFYISSNDLQKLAPKPKANKTSLDDVSSKSIGYYSMAVVVMCVGLTFAAVPLYRLFCQVCGNGTFNS